MPRNGCGDNASTNGKITPQINTLPADKILESKQERSPETLLITTELGIWMSATFEENQEIIERRAFPRIQANCPVLYQLRPNSRWLVARLEEYSATGISMVCDENLADGTEIAIQIKPGSLKTIPQLSAKGEVVRCTLNKENRFKVSCKILKVMRNK